ncbi:DUF1697 domain-containing protein [Rhodococcus kroppenstedtii]|uniref:DUF1697 domain-containing protein n=1 Tax=Rhodococcoides kroppenstedtii TaxID=293050 RepID=UPI002954208B|nr:DUF1697 domain-containing protein [Rhodococcus kroppenstedtii]MDV7198024.1 DUF1697 domain-containing protein [Rhodococcus kroppenstedtii]
MRFVVLLRGVNVGGVRLVMSDLRSALTAAGYADVTTVLASGNVLLTADGDAASVRSDVEALLRREFGYDAWVVVLTSDRLAEVVAAYPWETDEAVRHPYVIFSSDGRSTAELGALDGLDPAVERTAAGPHHVLFWEVVRGDTLGSVVGKASAKAAYKSTTTTRNLRTLRRLLA